MESPKILIYNQKDNERMEHKMETKNTINKQKSVANMVDVISTLTTITLNISDHRLKEETVRVDQKKKKKIQLYILIIKNCLFVKEWGKVHLPNKAKEFVY